MRRKGVENDRRSNTRERIMFTKEEWLDQFCCVNDVWRKFKQLKIKKVKKNNADNDAAIFPVNSREPELEAIVGEINVTDFQTRRLKNILSDKAAGYLHMGGGYYRKNRKSNDTTNFFSHRGKLYRVSISVQEVKF